MSSYDALPKTTKNPTLGVLVIYMQVSDTSTLQGLIQDITFLTGQNTTEYTNKDRVRNMNRWYMNVVSWIFRASGFWEFDDDGKTDQPSLKATLVNGQQDYTLPTSATTTPYTLQGGVTGGAILKIQTVQVLDVGGVWRKLKQIDLTEIGVAQEEFEKTDGLPWGYDIRGGSIFLYPAPATGFVTMASGLELFIAREPYVLKDDDTTREPGFAEQFHRILSLGAAYDWALAKGGENAAALRREIEELKIELINFYGDRNRDKKPRLMRRMRNLV